MNEQPSHKMNSNPGITDELISRYIEGLCAPAESALIETKMSQDPDFEKHIKTLEEIVKDFDPTVENDVPDHLIRRAKDLVHPRYGALLVEILAGIKDRAFERLSTTATILCGPQTAAPVLLRGEAIKPKQNILVEKKMNDLDIQVAVGLVDDSRTITVSIQSTATQKGLNGLRGILLLGTQELESRLSEDGRISFEDVSDGEYFIELHNGDQLLGAIKISLTAHG